MKEFDVQDSRSSDVITVGDDDVIDSLPDILTKMKDLGVTLLMWSVKFHICFLQTRAEVGSGVGRRLDRALSGAVLRQMGQIYHF